LEVAEMLGIAHLPLGPSSYAGWDVVVWIALVVVFVGAAFTGWVRSVRPKAAPEAAALEFHKAA
jgi:hypothetical protein